uniref:Uncharacterized protein n=1 Tax=Nelumbo nucifera TaxID=4432 RepID=A0A822YJL9_NELNU|nr:TPA_asm: hypothetical protein HUJ06_010016 [Nelumbo nucifera]
MTPFSEHRIEYVAKTTYVTCLSPKSQAFGIAEWMFLSKVQTSFD